MYNENCVRYYIPQTQNDLNGTKYIIFFRDSKARQEKCSPFGRMCSFHVSFGGEIIVKSLCGFVFIIFVLTNAFTKKFQLFFSRYTRKIEVKAVMIQMVSMTLFHTKIFPNSIHGFVLYVRCTRVKNTYKE